MTWTGQFRNPEALLSLAGSVLIEQHDEGTATDRRYFGEASLSALTTESAPQ